jgi:hypothetical protein
MQIARRRRRVTTDVPDVHRVGVHWVGHGGINVMSSTVMK